jgi:hypothetical protein
MLTRRRFTIQTRQVNPGVWAAALELAGGDTGRLEVVSDTEVLVHNRPGRRSRHRGALAQSSDGPPGKRGTEVPTAAFIEAAAHSGAAGHR